MPPACCCCCCCSCCCCAVAAAAARDLRSRVSASRAGAHAGDTMARKMRPCGRVGGGMKAVLSEGSITRESSTGRAPGSPRTGGNRSKFYNLQPKTERQPTDDQGLPIPHKLMHPEGSKTGCAGVGARARNTTAGEMRPCGSRDALAFGVEGVRAVFTECRGRAAGPHPPTPWHFYRTVSYRIVPYRTVSTVSTRFLHTRSYGPGPVACPGPDAGPCVPRGHAPWPRCRPWPTRACPLKC
jgi:hypothetical protein